MPPLEDSTDRQDPRDLVQEVRACVSSALGLGEDRPWIHRRLVELAHHGVFEASCDLSQTIGPEASQAVAQALERLDTPPLRKAGWVVVFDQAIMATEEAWLDPGIGEGAWLLANAPIAMAMILDRPSRRVVLHIEASGWAEMGAAIAADVPRTG